MTRYHHGNLRAALLQAAVAEVRSQGADKVSLRGLAGAVGVSPSAAYQHFGDKDELLLAVGQDGFAQLGARMRAALTAAPGDDDAAAVARFAAAGQAYVSFALEQPHTFRLMFGPLCDEMKEPGPGDLEPGEAGPDGEPGAFEVLIALLDDLERRDLLRVPNGVGLQLMIWSTVHGFAHLAIEGRLQVEVGAQVFGVIEQLVLHH